MLLATVEALAKRKPIRNVLSPASEGASSCLSTSSTAARFSFEFEVMMSGVGIGFAGDPHFAVKPADIAVGLSGRFFIVKIVVRPLLGFS